MGEYHDSLSEGGVTGYSMYDAWEDYRFGVAYSLVGAVAAAGAPGLSPDADPVAWCGFACKAARDATRLLTLLLRRAGRRRARGCGARRRLRMTLAALRSWRAHERTMSTLALRPRTQGWPARRGARAARQAHLLRKPAARWVGKRKHSSGADASAAWASRVRSAGRDRLTGRALRRHAAELAWREGARARPPGGSARRRRAGPRRAYSGGPRGGRIRAHPGQRGWHA